MGTRSASSARWLGEHESDPYVQRARKEGFRSRAVYKLAEIDRKDRLLRPGLVVVDLGAAPGGWSQYARPRLGPKGTLIALDILPMDPLPDVVDICGDFRAPDVLASLEAAIGFGRAVDLVLSDMAPNLSGINAADQASTLYLCELALDFALAHLKPDGRFVVKVFQGEGYDVYLKAIRASFTKVSIRKPPASRSRSPEVYLVGERPVRPKALAGA